MATDTGTDADGVADGRGLVLMQAVLVVFVAFLSAFVVATAAAVGLSSAGLDRSGLAFRVGVTVAQFLGFGVGLAGYLAVADQWAVVIDHVRLPGLSDAAYALGGLVALIGAAAVVGQLLSVLGIEVAQNQVVEIGRQNPEFFLYMIPVSLLFVGPFEELLFRGAVQGLLRRAWGPAVAIVAASAMFGVVHWIALTGGGSRLSYVAIAATLGVVLGVIYELSDNLAVPAVVHGVYNATLFGVQYAAATGALPA